MVTSLQDEDDTPFILQAKLDPKQLDAWAKDHAYLIKPTAR